MSVKIGQLSHEVFQELKHTSVYQPTVSSTNDWAKETLQKNDLHSPTVFLTDHQLAGRGRKGRTWIDPQPGTCFLSTWVFPLSSQPQPILTSLVGLATYISLQSSWPWLEWNLKAPNDLFIAEKKIAGLLLEVISQGAQNQLLIGFGLNVWACPSQFSSTCLKDDDYFTSPSVWRSFLKRLWLEYTSIIESNPKELSLYHQKYLLHALNQHPFLEAKYTHMDSHGSLYVGNNKTSWMDL